MLLPELSDFLTDPLRVPTGTIADRAKALRAAGMMSKGLQGPNRGAVMTNSDAVNLLLVNLVDHRRGDDVARTVKTLRDLPFVESSVIGDEGASAGQAGGFLFDLSFMTAQTFGSALDALLADLRSGEFSRLEKTGSPLRVSVTIDADNRDCFLMLSRERAIDAMGSWTYRQTAEPHKALVFKQVHTGDVLLRQLAKALGPPT